MKIELNEEQRQIVADLMKDLSIPNTEENRIKIASGILNYGFTTIGLNIGMFQGIFKTFPNSGFSKKDESKEQQKEITPYRCPKCSMVLVRPYPNALLQCNCRKWED